MVHKRANVFSRAWKCDISYHKQLHSRLEQMVLDYQLISFSVSYPFDAKRSRHQHANNDITHSHIYFVCRVFSIFTTSMYTLCCALGGFLYFFVKYLVHLCFVGRLGEQKPCYYATGKYWRNIVRATALVGIAFGVKLGLTNVGLDLVSLFSLL